MIGAQGERLSVATECPTCGAPVDFGEGSNALSCTHCRTNLLVTGRKRVLNYWIPPRIDAEHAVQSAREAEVGSPAQVRGPRLWFLPYYRITGFEIRVELVARERDLAPSAWAVDPTLGETGLRAASLRKVDVPIKEPEVHDRHIEKNFLALDADALAPYSIGVRAAVLRLELFRRGPLEALGTIVAPAFDPTAAIERGTRGVGGGEVVRRGHLALRRALVFFPFWTVEIRRSGRASLTSVDGVTGSLVKRGVAPSVLETLGTPLAGEAQTVGFRPLLCPNCGWELPLRPDDCVLCCGSCRRAWEIDGESLVDTPTLVIEAPDRDAARSVERTHLPFWSCPSRDGAAHLVPAFRCRRLKSVIDLATSYAQKPPATKMASAEAPELVGAFLDRDDAAALSAFVDAGDARGEALVWVPYRNDGYSLVDPHFGLGLAKNLLV